MSDNNKIPGGFYLKARQIQNSDIATAPPHIREIWDWLIKEANWKNHPVKKSGFIIKRGQCLVTYDDIREGLHWRVGWRKERYSKHHCEIAMKWLKKATMITTTKTTRGMIVTVLNYDKFQQPENYESHSENYRKATRKPQTTDTIRKEGEEREEGNRGGVTRARLFPVDFFPSEKSITWAEKAGFIGDIKRVTEHCIDHHRAKGNKFKDFEAAWKNWIRNEIKFRNRDNGKPGPDLSSLLTPASRVAHTEPEYRNDEYYAEFNKPEGG